MPFQVVLQCGDRGGIQPIEVGAELDGFSRGENRTVAMSRPSDASLDVFLTVATFLLVKLSLQEALEVRRIDAAGELPAQQSGCARPSFAALLLDHQRNDGGWHLVGIFAERRQDAGRLIVVAV
ncbi:MAG: hypothetical protein R3E51_00060 [Rhizobiaceae bacterium]